MCKVVEVCVAVCVCRLLSYGWGDLSRFAYLAVLLGTAAIGRGLRYLLEFVWLLRLYFRGGCGGLCRLKLFM